MHTQRPARLKPYITHSHSFSTAHLEVVSLTTRPRCLRCLHRRRPPPPPVPAEQRHNSPGSNKWEIRTINML